MRIPLRESNCPNRKIFPRAASFTAAFLPLALTAGVLFGAEREARAWTLSDLNPWKQIQEYRIFSLTRANPAGVRILVVPVIDDPINAPIYTRLASEFTNSLRSFASEVWLVTDLPDNPIKTGFYTAMPHILADYRLRNQLSMDLLRKMMPDFECDYIALFEVTDYDRFWVDEDLQYRVGVRAVLYDYEDGFPRLEKFHQGGRGRRLEEGAFNEAERFAVKGLVQALEKPLRESIRQREIELARKREEMTAIALGLGQRELAIHKYDLALMMNEVRKSQELARKAQADAQRCTDETAKWREEAEKNRALLEQYQGQAGEGTSAPQLYNQREGCPPDLRFMPSASPPAPSASLIAGTPSSGPRTPAPAASARVVDLSWLLDQAPGGEWEYVGPPPEEPPRPARPTIPAGAAPVPSGGYLPPR
ncbi:MAG: hypothetical protein GHCLOJNM_00665 [bacterium]|nr:hypothetical protein [bacterium]